MGMVSIKTSGSFRQRSQVFSAMEHGHARAIADAIKYLSEEVLPEAIRQDHDLHENGKAPEKNFGKD
jgi:hypothetical protein